MAISISSPQGHSSTAQRLGISPETTSVIEAKHTAIIKQNILNIGGSSNNNWLSEIQEENLLVVSPYDERPHLLDLGTLDTANQLLAKALVGLRCLRGDYATAPYQEIFNWPDVVKSVYEMAELSDFKWAEVAFYIVVFRSRIPPTTVYADLGVLDKAAHAEATDSGGFLK
jgi:hypothetical protein